MTITKPDHQPVQESLAPNKSYEFLREDVVLALTPKPLPSHPPVLPVDGVDMKQTPGRGWCVHFPYSECWVGVEALAGDARIFFAALQRCAWIDEVKQRKLLAYENRNTAAEKENIDEYIEAEHNADAWAAWGKDGDA